MNSSSNDKNSKEGDSYQSPSSRYGQNHILGITLVLIAFSAIALTNICAKWASTNHHPIDILFYRNIVALTLTTFWIKMRYGNFKILKTKRPFDHLKRGVIGTIGIGTAFGAFAILPATDATILLFTIPIFTALLSMPILGEKVGPLRWSAILFGFIGVYIAVDPSGDFNMNGVIIALISAVTSALTALYVRDLGKSEPAVRTVFYFLLLGTVITAVFLPFLGSMPLWPMVIILCLTGIFGFTNQMLKTTAYAIAPAAMLSPFIYTMLIWTALADIIIWQNMPTTQVLFGGAIIITSNLFLAWREKTKKS